MAWFNRQEPEPQTVVAVYQGSDDRLREFHPNSLQGMRVASALQTAAYFTDDFKASAVYRGATLLADLAAQLPWYAYQGGDPALTGSDRLEKAEKLDPQPQLLINPNTNTDRDDLLRQIILSLIFHGNAYLFGNMHDAAGRPTNIIVANPADVTVKPNDTNTRPIYTWKGMTMRQGYEWWHLSINKLPGTWKGIGPLEAGSSIVSGIRAADEYARRLFTESGTPSGVLKVPGKMTKDEADKLKQQWDEQHARGRGTAILSGGIEFEGISLTPEQAQFLATRAYGSQEVARLLGIPQWFLNAGSPPGTASALTYQNLNQVYVELTRNTLYPTYLRRIEKAMSEIMPRGFMVQFDLAKFLQSDIVDRANAAGTLIRSGFEPGDVATLLGLDINHTGVLPITVQKDESAVTTDRNLDGTP